MTIFSKCEEVLASGRNAALATIVTTSSGTPGKQGFKLILAEDGELFGTVGGGALEHRAIEEARAVLADAKSRYFHFDLSDLGMECGGNVELVIEYLSAVKPFLLFGGGHVARALCPILCAVGFGVTVFDPRPEASEYFGNIGVAVISSGYDDISEKTDTIARAEYAVIATHGHQHDYTVLKQLVANASRLRYIGLIGSSRKVRVTLGRLEEEGYDVPPTVYSPVGVKIGAQTAAEIAVSIAAEVVAVKNGHVADHMRATSSASE